MLFNLQGLWWPAYISLHIDSKFVFVCGLVVFPDSQGIAAGFMSFPPWTPLSAPGRAVQVWTQMDNPWCGLGLFRDPFQCVQPVLQAAPAQSSPWAAMAILGLALMVFLRADAAFGAAPSSEHSG